MTDDNHSERVAVITGAARGFGQAIAVGLAARGAQIAVVDRLDAAETIAAVQGVGGAATAHEADLTDPASVEVVGREILEAYGRADILVNNAGVIAIDDFFETSYERWRQVIAVNLDSQFLMTKALAGAMRDRGWGRIINVASNALGLVAPNLTPYLASKGGVIGLTRALATDLAPYGITVNAVSPTASRTPGGAENIGDEVLEMSAGMQAIKRVGTPEDIVGTVCFLASDDAGFVTGQTIVADGGWLRL